MDGIVKLMGDELSIRILDDPWVLEAPEFKLVLRIQGVEGSELIVGLLIKPEATMIWKSKFHERLKLFLWNVSSNILPTKDNMIRVNREVDQDVLYAEVNKKQPTIDLSNAIYQELCGMRVGGASKLTKSNYQILTSS
nr:hypothetical protein CFP56_45157 [Quercus suber]